MINDPFNLERFVTAQDDGGTFDRAVSELRRERKASHWMWFVFPQIAGLGQSTMARTFAIDSLDEARAYLSHPVLGKRLLDCASIVAGATSGSATEIFGGIDAQKLQSCMTLFLRAAPDETAFAQVLDRFFGGLADDSTDRLLAARDSRGT